RKYMPITFLTFFVSTLAIAGMPPFAGFFSKDEILWKAFTSPYGAGWIWALGTLTAGLTAFYMFRQVFMVFFGEFRGAHGGHHDDAHGSHGAHGTAHAVHHPHESPGIMTFPLIVLALGAVLVGFLNVPGGLGGSHRFETWLAPVLEPGHAAPVHEPHGVV